MPHNEEHLNPDIQSSWQDSLYSKWIANITQELFLPSIEISLENDLQYQKYLKQLYQHTVS